MAMQIKGTAVAECFNIAMAMDRFQRRWLSDDAIVEGKKDSFPQLDNEHFNAKILNRAMADDCVYGFRNIYEEGGTNASGVYAKKYRIDPFESGNSRQQHSFYFIVGAKGIPPVLSSNAQGSVLAQNLHGKQGREYATALAR